MLDASTIERMGEGPILVALSGGGDSVALLHLLNDRLGSTRLHAAIVDHKLREGSAADARRAADIAANLGIEAQILDLTWPADANHAHEAARALRYAALCNAARKRGARTIVTGHTRDDQAETVLLRGARGSGIRGLAGMRPFAPAPIWPEGRGLWIARPLLGVRRSELRAYLTARNATWLEDPANESQIHARVRARQTLAALEREGLDPTRFASFAERLQPHVAEIDRRASALIGEAASFDGEAITLDRARWRGDERVRRRALEALLLGASGAQRGATAAQLEGLSAALDQPNFTGATLGGAWLQPSGTSIVIRRDPGALSGRAGGALQVPPLPLPPGEETIWDGRVALTASEPGWSVAFNGRTPELQRGGEQRPLAAALPHWLLKERVRHVLGTD